MSDIVIQSYPNLRTCTLGIVTYHGAAHDRLAGTTQVLLQTMTRGTQNYTENEIAQLIDGKGGGLFSITEKDFAIIAAQIQPKYALKTLKLLYDIILNPRLEEDHFLIERQNLLQTLSQVKSSALQRLLFFDADKAVFGETHPLGRSQIGSIESLNMLTRNDLYTTHKDFLLNPWGFAVGAISRDLEQKINKSLREFFDFHKTKRKKNKTFPIRDVLPGNTIFSPEKDVNNSYLCINITTEVNKTNIGLARFSNAILGESVGSRMFTVLRDQKGFGYLTGTILKLLGKQLILRCFMETTPSRTEEALDSLLEIIIDLREKKITEDEYKTTRNYILGGIDLSFDDSRTIAAKLVNRSIHGLNPSIEAAYEEINTVTPESLLKWWETLLTPQNMSLAVSGAIEPENIQKYWKNHSLMK